MKSTLRTQYDGNHGKASVYALGTTRNSRDLLNENPAKPCPWELLLLLLRSNRLSQPSVARFPLFCIGSDSAATPSLPIIKSRSSWPDGCAMRLAAQPSRLFPLDGNVSVFFPPFPFFCCSPCRLPRTSLLLLIVFASSANAPSYHLFLFPNRSFGRPVRPRMHRVLF